MEPASTQAQPGPEQHSRNNRSILIVLSLLVVPCLSIWVLSIPPGVKTASFIHHAVNLTSFATVTSARRIPAPPFTLFSTSVVLPKQSHDTSAYVCVDETGVIAAVSATLFRLPKSCRNVIVDVAPLTIMPGLVDPHCHINSPGRDSWEGFNTALRAAAAGGTTTVLDMPINSEPATVDVASLELKLESLRRSDALVNVGLIGGVVPENADNHSELLDTGVLAVKSFMVDTQSPDFHMVSVEQLESATKFQDGWHRKRPGYPRTPYIVHAELNLDLDLDGNEKESDEETNTDFDHEDYIAYEAARPAAWETAAVQAVLRAAAGRQVHMHVAHVSAATIPEQIRAASGTLQGAIVSAETCPHYLLFSAEGAERGSSSTHLKCAPPVRSVANRGVLLGETFNDTGPIDVIASDHSPCDSALKDTDGNITAAWGGVAGLQYRLQATLRAAQLSGDVDIATVSKLLSEAPARLFGMASRKGAIEQGRDADIVLVDPHEMVRIDSDNCEHRHKVSAFDGQWLKGKVWSTIVRGRVVYEVDGEGRKRFYTGHGRYLRRGERGELVQKVIHSD